LHIGTQIMCAKCHENQRKTVGGVETSLTTSDVKLEFFSKSKLESKKSIKTRNLFLIVS